MALSLPTERTKPITDLGKQTILLYSAPKLGKSTFDTFVDLALADDLQTYFMPPSTYGMSTMSINSFR